MTNNKTLDTSDMRREFHKIYYNEIAPKMEKYEKERQFTLFLVSIIEILIAGAFCLVMYFLIQSIQAAAVNRFLIIVEVLLVVLAILIPLPFSSNFSKKLKNECMDEILQAFGDIQWYNAKSKLNSYLADTMYDYSESSLFSSYNRESSDDTFYGSYKGVRFSIIETHLWYETSGKHRSVRQVFKGVIIRFDANKPIKNNTIIAPKWDMNIKNRWFSLGSLLLTVVLLGLGWYVQDYEILVCGGISLAAMVGSLIWEKTSKDKTILREIKLEDPEFNKRYRAYSSNEVEGRYLITTAFMDRFKNLQTAFGARGAKCSFYGKSLMFAISTNKNIFELGSLFTPLNNPKQLQKFTNELISIFALVDYFKLAERIGL